MSTDREPQPGDGPDYRADHAFWKQRLHPGGAVPDRVNRLPLVERVGIGIDGVCIYEPTAHPSEVGRELSPAEQAVAAVLHAHFGHEPEADERAELASKIVMALALWSEPHCDCLWCSGETTPGGACWCEFCRHRQGDI